MAVEEGIMDIQIIQVWAPVFAIIGANLALMATSIGVAIALYLHTDKKIDSFKDNVNKEMRDFHKTLCDIQAGARYNGVLTEEDDEE